ncbi:MAG: AAA family ATPase, partial [Planctomycetota bacterium]
MRLKRLILQGVKSFAERTEFEIPEGITVIVGPNGCGKSNLVDAVKWVLGDQRPSSLRAKEMQDVIFFGTDGRRGLGFAEVSLVLENSDGALSLDYEEVVLTRRLYRSGESEYLINGNGVRLRDIRDLMMDAGGGLGSFSIIEQGNLEFLLQADPHERRLIFEEAAGISKYRARRREAARKRERTAENLERLRDVISEAQTRERSLKIQAGKAKRFREWTDALSRKRVAGALARYADLACRREVAEREVASVADAERAARDELEHARRETEEERGRLGVLQAEAAEGDADVAAVVAEARAAQEKRAARLREAQELADRAGRAAREAAEAAQRAAELGRDRDEAAGKRAAAEVERERAAQALRLGRDSLARLEEECKDLLRESEELDRKRSQALAEEITARNEEISLETEHRGLGGRLERLAPRGEASTGVVRDLGEARTEAALGLRRAREELRSLESRHDAAQEEVGKARAEAEAAAAEAAAGAERAAAQAARLEVLARLEEQGEGLDGGARAVLEAGRTGDLAGVRGRVADLVGDVGPGAALLDQALGG